jgi:hypothetical protein
MKLSLWQKIKLARLVNKLLNDDKMIEALKSKKLWVTVLGTALITLGTQLGFEAEQVNQVVNLLMTYLIGQSAIDTVIASKK